MKTVSIRLEDSDFDALTVMLANMGQTKQTFFESYTKTALRERRIPFIIADPVDPFYSRSNIARLEHSFKQAEDGNVITKTLDELEAMAGE